MFCPGCGIEEVHANQFCRACGSDLRRVRTALASSDAITASAASAREEIGRAVAAKIQATRSAEELSVVAEEVLPQIEKFLESPEEKRLRRVRLGMPLASIGLGTAGGVALINAIMTLRDEDLVFILGLCGVVCFFIGLGFMLNGLLFTIPKKGLADHSSEGDSQRRLDLGGNTNDLKMPPAPSFLANPAASSVTENTTQHLDEKGGVSRKAERS